ncbi:hypothetical protein HYH03_009898 [Edaphochlamys debaryana]|uniref:Uncharacterized protein n=1 Tax=Edaphochlamys debaryana TaxID=47281 RepID=A0A835Y382_9CHLO|nr:hypothetical protein HYH03_009898 [Edaphochlamys debaryana]|eukprot:KAG2491735.1 hypothetical protein HYH03_009898 [Edaphochlamys debaryana]
MADKPRFLKSLMNTLYGFGFKEPWRMTGVRSLPDFEHYLPKGTEYRKFSPGNQPVKAKIPHDPPKLVYDIKYFVRDYRRNNKYTARTVDSKTEFDFQKLFNEMPVKPDQVKTVPMPATTPHRGY